MNIVSIIADKLMEERDKRKLIVELRDKLIRMIKEKDEQEEQMKLIKK